jgi:RNA polymerase-associated protein
MLLYSTPTCIYSHSCRIVLYEKDVDHQVRYIESAEDAEILAEFNPYGDTPTLVDRDLVLYSAQVINEYLDERLPHPPLMPVDPVARGKARLLVMRLHRDWFSLLVDIEEGDRGAANRARQSIRDGLISISPVFANQPYMLGEEFSLVDCALVPLLWRLPALKVELPRQAKPLTEYADRQFQRKSFRLSLSEREQEMRAAAA